MPSDNALIATSKINQWFVKTIGVWCNRLQYDSPSKIYFKGTESGSLTESTNLYFAAKWNDYLTLLEREFNALYSLLPLAQDMQSEDALQILMCFAENLASRSYYGNYDYNEAYGGDGEYLGKTYNADAVAYGKDTICRKLLKQALIHVKIRYEIACRLARYAAKVPASELKAAKFAENSHVDLKKTPTPYAFFVSLKEGEKFSQALIDIFLAPVQISFEMPTQVPMNSILIQDSTTDNMPVAVLADSHDYSSSTAEAKQEEDEPMSALESLIGERRTVIEKIGAFFGGKSNEQHELERLQKLVR